MTAHLVQPAAVLRLEYGIQSEAIEELAPGRLLLNVDNNPAVEGDPEDINRYVVQFEIQLQRHPDDYGFLFCRGQLGVLVADEEPDDSIISLCFFTMVSLIENSIRETGSVISTGWPTDVGAYPDEDDAAGKVDGSDSEEPE